MPYDAERNRLPSQNRLREVFEYDPETGIVTWKIRTSSRAMPGDVAGSPHCRGYVQVGLDGATHLMHRIIWKWMTGEDPRLEVDHRDQVKTNNRWSNLRLLTIGENHQNISPAQSHSQSGIRGVSFCKQTKRWVAQIQIDGKRKNLGRYSSPEEARLAYEAAKAAHHPAWSH